MKTMSKKQKAEQQAKDWREEATALIAAVSLPGGTSAAVRASVLGNPQGGYGVVRVIRVSVSAGLVYHFDRQVADITLGTDGTMAGLCDGDHGLTLGGVDYESRQDAPASVRRAAESAFLAIAAGSLS